MHTVFTIGHSTHSIEEFVELLRAQKISQLVDIRSVPRSRHNPQFEQSALEKSLPKAGISYMHVKELGGLRHPVKTSPNMGWHNESFRGYADYMQSDDFARGLGKLIEKSKAQPTVIMCAEAVPWRCHRSLVADALLVRGVQVLDIFSATNVKPHSLTPFAVVRGMNITYPPEKAGNYGSL